MCTCKHCVEIKKQKQVFLQNLTSKGYTLAEAQIIFEKSYGK
jgi:hypothetical protein